jgi:hypothetical protein
MNEIKFTQVIHLEELLKERWIPCGNWANNCIMMGRNGEKLIYDLNKEEIIIKYSTEIKK